MLGFTGVLKEDFYMTITYAVLITSVTLVTFLLCSSSSYLSFQTVLYFIICGTTYAFAYDLRRIRALQFPNSGIIIRRPQPAPTIVNTGPGQFGPVGQRYVTNAHYSGQYVRPLAPLAPLV